MAFPLTLLSSPRNLLVAGLALGLAAVSLFAYVQTVRLDAANTRADALGQRLTNVNAQIVQAQHAVQAAADMNARLQAQIEAYRTAQNALQRAIEDAERVKAERDRLARQAAVEAREADRERRAREDNPTPEEMRDALRSAAGAL